MIYSDVATEADDAQLRRVVGVSLPGSLSLSFEREPNFFLAGSIEGDVYDVLAARDDKTGEIVGVGSRSIRDAWINGEPGRLGYLGQLRIVPEYRGKPVLSIGFVGFRRLHVARPVPYYVTTIIADNTVARSVLEKDRKIKPHYEPWSVLVTLAILLGKKKSPVRVEGITVRRATQGDLGPIVECLRRNNQRFQFAPTWTIEDLTSDRCRGLRASDFLVAVRGEAVVGCLALWDQQSFKQSVVRGYEGPLAYARPLYNGIAPLVGLPRLPAVGEAIRHAYVSHLAFDGDNEDVCMALLVAAYNRALETGFLYLTVALCEGHPLLPSVKRAFRNIEYRAIVYVVYYPDGEASARKLDRRTPHLELAVL